MSSLRTNFRTPRQIFFSTLNPQRFYLMMTTLTHISPFLYYGSWFWFSPLEPIPQWVKCYSNFYYYYIKLAYPHSVKIWRYLTAFPPKILDGSTVWSRASTIITGLSGATLITLWCAKELMRSIDRFSEAEVVSSEDEWHRDSHPHAEQCKHRHKRNLQTQDTDVTMLLE